MAWRADVIRIIFVVLYFIDIIKHIYEHTHGQSRTCLLYTSALIKHIDSSLHQATHLIEEINFLNELIHIKHKNFCPPNFPKFTVLSNVKRNIYDIIK